MRVSALPAGAVFPSTDVSVTSPAAAVNAAAAVEDRCGSCWAFGGSAPVAALPTPGQVLNSVGFGLERLLDSVDRWLAGLGGGPITDFLAGAVWLVRSALFPAGGGVAPGGTAACVSTGDCSGQDLTGVDLAGQNLSQVNFTGANLTRALLTGSNLANAQMDGAKLYGAQMVGTLLSGASLSAANLENANLDRAALQNADFTGANLQVYNLPTGAQSGIGTARSLTGANLSRQNLRGVDLSGKNLTAVNFNGADLQNVNFQGATLANAVLSAARLAGLGDRTGADFRNADLRGALLNGVLDRDVRVEVAVEPEPW